MAAAMVAAVAGLAGVLDRDRERRKASLAAGFLLGIRGLRFAKPIAELGSYDAFAASPGNPIALCVRGLVLLSAHGLRRLSPTPEEHFGPLVTVVYVAVELWLCAAVSTFVLHAPEAQLVAATTALLIALAFTGFWLRHKFVGEERGFASGVIVAAGAALVRRGRGCSLVVGCRHTAPACHTMDAPDGPRGSTCLGDRLDPRATAGRGSRDGDDHLVHRRMRVVGPVSHARYVRRLRTRCASRFRRRPPWARRRHSDGRQRRHRPALFSHGWHK